MPIPEGTDNAVLTLMLSSVAVILSGLGLMQFGLVGVLLWFALTAAVGVLHRFIWVTYGHHWQGEQRRQVKYFSYGICAVSVVGVGVIWVVMIVFVQGYVEWISRLTGIPLKCAIAGSVIITGVLAFRLKQYSQYFYGITEVCLALLTLLHLILNLKDDRLHPSIEYIALAYVLSRGLSNWREGRPKFVEELGHDPGFPFL